MKRRDILRGIPLVLPLFVLPMINHPVAGEQNQTDKPHMRLFSVDDPWGECRPHEVYLDGKKVGACCMAMYAPCSPIIEAEGWCQLLVDFTLCKDTGAKIGFTTEIQHGLVRWEPLQG